LIIILDTNVLSALMLERPDPMVAEWVIAQDDTTLFTTVICQAEIRSGIAMLPEGRRRARLQREADWLFHTEFAGRVLAFDGAAADGYGFVTAARRRAGRSISVMDHLIAAIARSRGAAVATRNLDDFAACGLDVINPWLP